MATRRHVEWALPNSDAKRLSLFLTNTPIAERTRVAYFAAAEWGSDDEAVSYRW